eukprot:1138503-Pelagomonas_calceolata.AAC.17
MEHMEDHSYKVGNFCPKSLHILSKDYFSKSGYKQRKLFAYHTPADNDTTWSTVNVMRRVFDR